MGCRPRAVRVDRRSFGFPWVDYERHREAMIRAYQSSGHNLSATERMLKRQGIKASRRWLREYLEKWGER